MKYEIATIETFPLLYDGLWLGSKLKVWIEREDHSAFMVSRVFDRDTVRVNIENYKDQIPIMARTLARSLVNDIGKEEHIEGFAVSMRGPVSDPDLKHIGNVLRLKLPVFLNYMGAKTLAVYQNSENEWEKVKPFPVDERGKYPVAEVDLMEWPWVQPTPLDAEQLSEAVRYQSILTKIMMQQI